MSKKKITILVILIVLAGCTFLFQGSVLAVEQSASNSTTSGSFFEKPSFNGIVPCGTDENNVPCTLCHFFIGMQRLFKYGGYLSLTFVFAGLFFAGIVRLTSMGSEEMIKKANFFLEASLKGFGIVLGAWLIITSILSIAPVSQGLGIGKINWYTFSCGSISSSNIAKGALQSLEIQCEEGATDAITLDSDSSTEKPDNYQLKAVAKYANGSSEDVTQKATWSATDETIIKVSSGKVQGIQTGYTSVTAKYSESGSSEQKASANVFMNTCPLSAAPEEDEEEESNESSMQDSQNDHLAGIFQNLSRFVNQGLSNVLDNLTVKKAVAARKRGCDPCVKRNVSRSKCELIAGNKDAKFKFIIVKYDDPAKIKYRSPCEKPVFWDKNDKKQIKRFEENAKKLAGGLDYLDPEFRSQFAVYISDKILSTTTNIPDEVDVEDDCGIGDGATVYFNYVQNSERGILNGFFDNFSDRAFAHEGSGSYYCINELDEKKRSGFVFAHEQIGHSFASLSDEYFDLASDAKERDGAVRDSINCTVDPKCKKWSKITSGCYEGCMYMKKGVFRSSDTSAMKNYHTNFSNFQKKIINYKIVNYPQVLTSYIEPITIKAW